MRIVTQSGESGEVSIEAIDDAGVSAGTAALPIAGNATAQFNVAELERGDPRKGIAEGVGASRTVSAAELENGAEGLAGSLGDGAGKWRPRVVSDRPILVMGLLASPVGHLVNISSAPGRGAR